MWFRKKKPPAPSYLKAAKRAQQSTTQELQYWVGISLPIIQGLVTSESLDEAEQYTLSVYEIIRELNRRKQLDGMVADTPFR
jgi:hypothetical protein